MTRWCRRAGRGPGFVERGEGGGLSDTVFEPGLSKAGDHVDLRAGIDAIAVVSNCPQVNNPCTGLKPTPIRVTVWRPG